MLTYMHASKMTLTVTLGHLVLWKAEDFSDLRSCWAVCFK